MTFLDFLSMSTILFKITAVNNNGLLDSQEYVRGLKSPEEHLITWYFFFICLFIYLFILTGRELLYNVVLASAI